MLHCYTCEIPDQHVMLTTSSCFAVSGLASHPFGSWKARNDRVDFMWLRDGLPKHCSNFRCIIYGYDSRLPDSRSFQDIEDISKALTRRLRSIGCSSPSAKPTILLAHSLGGIVLKEALVQMARSNEWEVFLLSNVIKIILFGVPNRGMRISHLIPMAKSQPNEPFIHRLSTHSMYLSQLDEQFNGISCYLRSRLVSIYETSQSQTPRVSRRKTCSKQNALWYLPCLTAKSRRVLGPLRSMGNTSQPEIRDSSPIKRIRYLPHQQ